MTVPRSPAPVLTALQSAWLCELGVSARFLAHFQGTQGAAPAVTTSVEARATPGSPSARDAQVPVPDAQTAAANLPGAVSPLFKAGQLAATLLGKPVPVDTVSPPPVVATSAPVSGAVRSIESGTAGGGRAQTALEAPAEAAFEALCRQVVSCTACGLHHDRHLPVVGAGATTSIDLMVIGEAPGAEDDRVGLPFRGKAGELLQAMLRAIGTAPDDRVYYTHLLKCRPVGNRLPAPEEVQACLVHLRQQIALLRPAQLLVLGRVAAQALLGDVPVESLRGRLHTYAHEGRAIPVVVTYHPAALLSRPRHKAAAWQDLSLLRVRR